MSLQLAYWFATGALTLLVIWKGSMPMKRTIAAIVGVLFASLGIHGFVAPFPSEVYCLLMLLVDALAAAIVLIKPAGRFQALVGITYLVQCGLYAGYLGHPLINNEKGDINSLWTGLSILAMLQLALVSGWWLHERGYWRSPVRSRSPAVDPAYRQGPPG